jgi:transcriptional regulator with XRE-family HTH domain
LRAARRGAGLTQKQLAEALGVEPITVSRWERGATTPDLEVLRLVAGATGKPLSFFVDDGPSGRVPASPELADATARIEAASARIADESERLALLLSELVEELRAARAGS